VLNVPQVLPSEEPVPRRDRRFLSTRHLKSGIKPPTRVPPRVPPTVAAGGLDGSLRVPSRPALLDPKSKKPYTHGIWTVLDSYVDAIGKPGFAALTLHHVEAQSKFRSLPSYTWSNVGAFWSDRPDRTVPTGPSREAAIRAYKFQISERKFSFPASARSSEREFPQSAFFPASTAQGPKFYLLSLTPGVAAPRIKISIINSNKNNYHRDSEHI
jgi:hypothetical protein